MKVVACPIPEWFAGSEILIQIIFAIVTFFVAYYSYKAYQVSRSRSVKFFGIGFLGISIAYLVQAALNFMVLQGVHSTDIARVATAGAVNQMIPLSVVAVFTHMIIMTASLGLLAYVTLKSKGVKPLLLVWSLSIAALLLSQNFSIAFYVIASILLLFMTAQHYQRLEKAKNMTSLIVFLGFGLVFLGMLQIAFATSLNLLYISGHIILLFGYLLLLWSLLRVVLR